MEACDECVTLENYYASNPVGFVLFFERALMGHHKYKQSIVEAWIETCKDLRWSRIACGMVDMVSDRAYAERYIDPQTAPAHIVVTNGQPVMASKEQIQVLLSKPGDKTTMMAHVMDMLKDVGTIGNISLSVQVNSKQAMQGILKRHHLVIAAFVQEDRGLADAFRAAAQEAVLAQGIETAVPSLASETSADSGRRGKGASAAELDKSRIAFAACIGKGLGSAFFSESSTVVAAFVNGQIQPGALPIKAGAKPGDTAMLDIVKKVTMKAASGSEEKKTQEKGSAKKNTESRKDKKKTSSEL